MGLLPGWQHYIDFTVPAEKVTEDLAHFPVCIQIRESAGINNVDLTPIFDEVGENYKKIAVCAEDGVTQLYVEVVSWDSITDEYAELHVSKSGWTLNGNVENKIRIYFDNNHADNDSFVGLTGSIPAQNVWNPAFKGVWHMNDATTSTILDSTSNDNSGLQDEIRVSKNVVRSSGWVSASYETQRDQFYNIGDFVHLNPIALFCA